MTVSPVFPVIVLADALSELSTDPVGVQVLASDLPAVLIVNPAVGLQQSNLSVSAHGVLLSTSGSAPQFLALFADFCCKIEITEWMMGRGEK